MPFIQANIKKEIEEKRKDDSEFREAWDESRAEYYAEKGRKYNTKRISKIIR